MFNVVFYEISCIVFAILFLIILIVLVTSCDKRKEFIAFGICLIISILLSINFMNKRDSLYKKETVAISRSKFINKYYTDDRHGDRTFYLVYELGEVEVSASEYYKTD